MKPLQNRHRFVCYFNLNVSYELVFFFVYLYLPSPRVRRADTIYWIWEQNVTVKMIGTGKKLTGRVGSGFKPTTSRMAQVKMKYILNIELYLYWYNVHLLH